jgi:hypothetical protein
MSIKDLRTAARAGSDARLRWTRRWLVAALSLAGLPGIVHAQALRGDCCATPTTIELLGDIAGRLPGDAFLRRFTLTNGEVQIQGLSTTGVNGIVESLRRSEMIESPAVKGAVIPDASTQKEMFVISASVRSSSRDAAGGSESTPPAFLPEGDFDAAAAGLVQRLVEVVASKGGNAERCQLIQKQYARSTRPEPFERVTIKARMRCDWPGLAPILHALETTPGLFIDEAQIWKQTGYRTPGSNAPGDFLDVRFDVYGYLRGHSTAQTPHGEVSARSAPFAASRDPFNETAH